MPLYFMVHDAAFFQEQLRPALTASWQQRSFEPCRSLCQTLTPMARAFMEKYHIQDAPLLFQIAQGVHFDRDYWRLLVSEVLLLGAAEVPQLQTAPDTLTWLLAPGQPSAESISRASLVPIQQAHYGTRDLVLGGFYRPESAGYNNREDVARLADYLSSCDSACWTIEALRPFRTNSDDNDLIEEMEFARESLETLTELYRTIRERDQLVVCEMLQ